MAKISTKAINSVILTIVVIIVLFSAYAELVPEAVTAGSGMNDSLRCAEVGCAWNTSSTWLAIDGAQECAINASPEGNSTMCPNTYTVPLSGFFSAGGVVFMIVMAALIILIVQGLLKKKE